MLPAGGDGILGWLFIQYLDVGSERRARVDALDQIVTEQLVLGTTSGHRCFERIDVVDALADERPFREEILVDVGNGRRVGIDPRWTGGEARKHGLARAHGRSPNARLD